MIDPAMIDYSLITWWRRLEAAIVLNQVNDRDPWWRRLEAAMTVDIMNLRKVHQQHKVLLAKESGLVRKQRKKRTSGKRHAAYHRANSGAGSVAKRNKNL